MSLCIIAGGKAVTLAAAAFTLSWTHSVERTEWREAWRLTPAGLELTQARVKGSGAGVDPPEDARLENGWWIYAPAVRPLSRLVLASSGATASGWRLCVENDCMTLGARPDAPVVVEPCPEGAGRGLR